MGQILTQSEADMLQKIEKALKENKGFSVKDAIEEVNNNSDYENHYYDQAIRQSLKDKGVIFYDDKYNTHLNTQNLFAYDDNSHTTFSEYFINKRYETQPMRLALISDVHVPDDESKKEFLINSTRKYGIVNTFLSVVADSDTPNKQERIYYILTNQYADESPILKSLKESGDDTAIVHNCIEMKKVIDITEGDLPLGDIERGTGLFIEAYLDKGYINEKSLEFLDSNIVKIEVPDENGTLHLKEINRYHLWRDGLDGTDQTEEDINSVYNTVRALRKFEQDLIKNITTEDKKLIKKPGGPSI